MTIFSQESLRRLRPAQCALLAGLQDGKAVIPFFERDIAPGSIVQ